MIKMIKKYIKKRKRIKQLNKEIKRLDIALKHALIRGDVQLSKMISGLLLVSIEELKSIQ